MTAATSDLSIEFAHVYLPELDERRAERAAQAARQWAVPVIEAYEQAGLTVSTVVMLDDYFAPAAADTVQGGLLVREACEAAGVRVDHLARESDCAESVSLMRAHLADEPTVRRRTEGAIGLRVDLHDEHPTSAARIWSCPILSAWWQLIRLGMLEDEHGVPVAPPRTQSRSQAPPFHARYTLTLLEPRFLEIEHAARAILERVRLPDAWLRRVREGRRTDDQREHLRRIAYMFVPAGFECRTASRRRASRPETNTIPSYPGRAGGSSRGPRVT